MRRYRSAATRAAAALLPVPAPAIGKAGFPRTETGSSCGIAGFLTDLDVPIARACDNPSRSGSVT
jgi:hypothetical protein